MTSPSNLYDSGAADEESRPREVTRFVILWQLLWNKGDELRFSCEEEFGEMELLSGVPWSRKEGSDFFVDQKQLQSTTFTPTAKVLDLKNAPGWDAAVQKYGTPKHGILPAMRRHHSNQRMLIIEDYETTFDLLVEEGEDADAAGVDNDKAHAVILGNPGIGKTLALGYFLYRLLLLAKPVLYRRDGNNSILFTENGVEWDEPTIELTMDRLEDEDQEVWVLADRVEPRTTDQNRSTVRMIEATSPDLRQYQKWAKIHNASIYCLDMWSWEEVYMLKVLHQFPVKTVKGELQETTFIARLWEAYLLFGGEPRHLYNLGVLTTGQTFERKMKDHIVAVKQACHDAVQNQAGRRADLILSSKRHSHIYMATRPYSESDEGNVFGHKRPVYIGKAQANQPRSLFIESILADEILELTRAESFSVFQRFQKYPSARGLSGSLFERIYHSLMRIRTVGKLTHLHEFIGLSNSSDALQKRTARSVGLEALMQCPTTGKHEMFDSVEELRERITDRSGKFDTTVLGIYFQPTPSNFTAIDSLFFYRKGPTGPVMLALLQHTVGACHPIKVSGLQEIFEILPSDVKTKGRATFGVLAFVTTPQNYPGFTKQSYSGQCSKDDKELWTNRFLQMKLCVEMETFRKDWICPREPTAKPKASVPPKRKFLDALERMSKGSLKGDGKMPAAKKARTKH